jgi:hypothetical protein
MATSHFDRSLLPPARAFYEKELGKLSRADRKGNCAAGCPFHNSKSKKSLSVNINTGQWWCFGGCGGGDILSFVQKRQRLSFLNAAKTLGAWDEQGKPAKVRPRARIRYLVMDFVIDCVEHRAEVLDEPRTELQRLRRFYAEASDRLAELRNGDREREEDETELQWALLATTWSLIAMENR